MKKGMLLGFLCLAVVVAVGNAQDVVPVAVSPGADNGSAIVRQSCPTFSWTAVSWALTYKVVVFKTGEGETPAYEKIAASASPVLVKEIPGKAFSWTPSADESLINGGSYVWYVGAMVNAAQGSWSEGRKFIIAESPAWSVVSKPREAGIGAGDSRQATRDEDLKLAAEAKENFNLKDDPASQDLVDIEGTEGTSNTFYGTNAGNTTMTGTENSFFGSLAGNKNTSGAYNTFMGRGAGYLNSTGLYNTFVGRAAGYSNTAASANTFLGYLAGFATTGGSNTFIGSSAGLKNAGGIGNTFIGGNAGYSNTTGNNNTFVGIGAGYFNTSGYYNAFLGGGAGEHNTTGYYNAFLGHWAGNKNTSGYQNTFLGYMAGYTNSTGFNNTFIGKDAGLITSKGHDNVFFGALAGHANTEGSQNAFVGSEAGQKTSTGHQNTYIGSCAGYVNETGVCNTFIGDYAGFYNSYGDNNLFIGNSAGENEMGSNKLYIDVSSTASPLIYGEFDNDILNFNGKVAIQTGVAPTHLLDVGTSGAYCDGGAWVDGSSREFKENIKALTSAEALQAFEKLEPVKFNYKENKDETYLGFIAEDVPDLVAMKDRKGLNPMDMVAMLTKVVQEQMKVNQEQQKALSSQEKAISELKEEIAKIKGKSQKEK